MRRYSPINISSDDEDANQPCSSKGKGSKKIDGRVKSIEDRLLKLEGAHSSEGNSDQKCRTIVNEIKEEMRCFICKLILSRDLSLLPCCNQLACSTCLSQWAASTTPETTCPLCRADFNGNVQNPTFPRVLFTMLDIIRKYENEGNPEQ